MTLSSNHYTVAALIASLAVAGCSAHQESVQTAPAPTAAARSQEAAIAKARADSLRHPYVQADVDFMMGMIGHHAQAIVMSGWAPTHEANPSIQILAKRIINAQQDEIATMQTWLRDRKEPVPEVSGGGTVKMAMHDMHHDMQHDMLMPGMLTAAQMTELDSARAADFDRLFLTYMIQHHRGAVTMVKQLFGSYGAGQDETVFKFASDVNVDQTTEIARMEKMLAALPPAPHTP